MEEAPPAVLHVQAVDWHAVDMPASKFHSSSVRAKTGGEWAKKRKQKFGKRDSGASDDSDSESDTDSCDGEDAFRKRHVFAVHGFGRTLDGRAVALRLTKFTPYFFVRPDGAAALGDRDCEDVVDAVAEAMAPVFRAELRGGSLRTRKEARGFQAGETRDFVCLAFDSMRAMRHAANKTRGGAVGVRAQGRRRKLVTYESSIDPLVRALHAMDIQTAGWLDVRTDKAYPSRERRGNGCASEWTPCETAYTLSYKHVAPHLGGLQFKTAPFVVAAYDIECVGTSENFPVPVKTYDVIADKLVEILREAVSPDIERSLRATKSQMRGIITAFLLMCYGVEPPEGSETSEAIERFGGTNVLARANAIRVRTKKPFDPARLHALCWETSEDARDVFICPPAFKDNVERPTEEEAVRAILNSSLPALAGDTLTQIGITLGRVGDPGCTKRWIGTLGTCASLPTAPDAVVVECRSERELLLAFRDEIASSDPDVVCDYNGSNFDWSFMWGRALELGLASPRRGERERKEQRRPRGSGDCDEFMRGLSRLHCSAADFVERNMSSSAMGDNLIRQVEMPGRVAVDIYREVLKTHKLDSYKLDSVASLLVGDNKHPMDHHEMKRLQEGTAEDRALVADYCVQDCALCLKLIHKLKIVPGAMAMASLSRVPLSAIFQRGQGVKTGSLVFYTCRKFKKLMRDMPRPPRDGEEGAEEETSYKGATVQKAMQGLYDKDPVAVLDFASMYPSSIISGGKDFDAQGRRKAGISYDNIVDDERYIGLPGYLYHTIEYPLISGTGDKERVVGVERCVFARPESDEEHDRDPGVLSVIEQEMLRARKRKRKQMWHRRVETTDGRVFVGEVQRVPGLNREAGEGGEGGEGGDRVESPAELRVTDEAGEVHVVRENEVASNEEAYTDAEREVMDCQQLSFKLTANSLYGQLGARTSEIRDKRLAACTTAVGRDLIQSLVVYCETRGPAVVSAALANSTEGQAAMRCASVKVVYGDTDSVFVTMAILDGNGRRLEGREALGPVMKGSEAIAKTFSAMLPFPQNLEDEKTFFPLFLKGKKMYVGNMYEDGTEHYKTKSMGLVTKRRDNAPIAKRAVNAVLDPIMTSFDVAAGLEGLARVVSELVDGSVAMEDLVVTKTLKGSYKNPGQIAHKVLAERIGRRDAGSKPAVNARIPYVFVEIPGNLSANKRKTVLQGDRIEDPEYVRQNGLKPDLLYYLENQVVNYCVQLLGVIVERLPGYSKDDGYWERLEAEMEDALRRAECSEEQVAKRIRTKIDTQRQEVARDLVFGKVLATMRMKRDRQSVLTDFFRSK
jgi:DNA polymerase elongation subunit (family B)